MNLRNVFLSAVIFSVGIASAVAEEPADENTRRETTYLFGDSAAEGTSSYTRFLDFAENDPADAMLFEHSGSNGSESGLSDYSVGYTKGDIYLKRHEASTPADSRDPLLSAEKDPAKDETAQQAASRLSDEDIVALHFYDLSVSFADSVSETIGFTGRDNRNNPLVFFEVAAETPDNLLLSDNGSYKFLSFEKNAFSEESNRAKLLSGNTLADYDDEENIFDIISSLLSIPFALVSIALCSGLMLVMFTSTGKKTNN